MMSSLKTVLGRVCVQPLHITMLSYEESKLNRDSDIRSFKLFFVFNYNL